MRLLLPLAVLLLLFSLSALAGFEGDVTFTDAERAAHQQAKPVITAEASACLGRVHAHHVAFYKKHGISPYYGANSKYAGLSEKKRRRYLEKRGLDPALASQLSVTSCVGMVLGCLEQGFTKAGQLALWQRVKRFTVANGSGGLALQHGLRALGWKVLYWNPDTRRHSSWAEAEERRDRKNRMRYWGFHEEHFRNVSARGYYLYNRVDDYRTLLNFGEQTPELLMGVPFFVGTAHGGYHVFAGARGQVIESHAFIELDYDRTIESSPFNPLKGLGPGQGLYRSGLVAVP